MRTNRKAAYERKYGKEDAAIILRLLATNAANGRWKAYYARQAK